jgi:hypothetical protein
VAAAAAVGIAAVAPLLRSRPLGYVHEPGPAGRGEAPTDTLRFSDGSTVVLAPGARAQVLGTTPTGAHVSLAEGGAHVHVVPRARTSWQVDAGPYTVAVHGTEFDLEWIEDRGTFTLALATGAVVVRGPLTRAEGLELRAGDLLVARPVAKSLRVLRGRGTAATTRGHDLATRYAAALSGLGAGADSGNGQPRREARALLDHVGRRRCSRVDPSPAASAVPDPGHVLLTACERREGEPSGRGVAAVSAAEPWVRVGEDGCLKYTEDPRGNAIPDFSQVGYHNGEASIPTIAAPPGARPLAPGGGDDDTAVIQAAIDAVGALAPDANGFRGAVELDAGVFVLKGTLHLGRSGVVLRGQGTEGPRATVLRAVGSARTVIELGPHRARRTVNKAAMHNIVQPYVPVGARSFELDHTTDLAVGDNVVVRRPHSPRWLCAIGMEGQHRAEGQRPSGGWSPRGALTFERRITAIQGNRVTVDIPLTTALEREYSQAFLAPYDFPERVTELGVEDLAGHADFADGRMKPGRSVFVWAWAASDSWLRRIVSDGFGNGLVRLGEGSKAITVEDATFKAGPGSVSGFSISGQQNLIQRSRAYGDGIHAFTMMSGIQGPNAVVDFAAVGRGSDITVPMRWSSGVLLDNVRMLDEGGVLAGEIGIFNHEEAGRSSRHGWGGANSVVWNSHAASVVVDNPPTAQNWVLGGSANVTQGTGFFGLLGVTLRPASLYRAQLAERVGPASPVASSK